MKPSVEELISFVKGNIPDLGTCPFKYTVDNLNSGSNLILEFGVFTGSSINYIAEKHPNNTIYGFDTFEGLPEDWRPKYGKGYFNLNGNIPHLLENVEPVKGLFNETLPTFLKTHPQKIGFVHIDSDLYSSAKCVLDNIKNHLAPDCVIVFDELVNFEYFEGDTSELRAFYEWVHENNVEFEWIGMHGPLNLTLTKGIKGFYYEYHQNVAVKIISVGKN